MRRLLKEEESNFFKIVDQIAVKVFSKYSENYNSNVSWVNDVCLEEIFSLSESKRKSFLKSKCWKKVPTGVSYYSFKRMNDTYNSKEKLLNMDKKTKYQFCSQISNAIIRLSTVSKKLSNFIIKNCDGVILLHCLKDDFIIKNITTATYNKLFETHDDRVLCHLIKTAPEKCVKKQLKNYKGKNKKIIALFRERISSNFMHKEMIEKAKDYLTNSKNSWQAASFIITNKVLTDATQEEVLDLIDCHQISNDSYGWRDRSLASLFLSCLSRENVYARLSYFKKTCSENLGMYLDYSGKIK